MLACHNASSLNFNKSKNFPACRCFYTWRVKARKKVACPTKRAKATKGSLKISLRELVGLVGLITFAGAALAWKPAKLSLPRSARRPQRKHLKSLFVNSADFVGLITLVSGVKMKTRQVVPPTKGSKATKGSSKISLHELLWVLWDPYLIIKRLYHSSRAALVQSRFV